jgi:hypothetical protein
MKARDSAGDSILKGMIQSGQKANWMFYFFISNLDRNINLGAFCVQIDKKLGGGGSNLLVSQ